MARLYRECLTLILILISNTSLALPDIQVTRDVLEIQEAFKTFILHNIVKQRLDAGETGSAKTIIQNTENIIENANIPGNPHCTTMHCADFTPFGSQLLSQSEKNYRYMGVIMYSAFSISESGRDIGHIAPMFESRGQLYLLNDPYFKVSSNVKSIEKVTDLPTMLPSSKYRDVRYRFVFDTNSHLSTEVVWGTLKTHDPKFPAQPSSNRYTAVFSNSDMDIQVALALSKASGPNPTLRVTAPSEILIKQTQLSVIQNAGNLFEMYKGNMSLEELHVERNIVRTTLLDDEDIIRTIFKSILDDEHGWIIRLSLKDFSFNQCEV